MRIGLDAKFYGDKLVTVGVIMTAREFGRALISGAGDFEIVPTMVEGESPLDAMTPKANGGFEYIPPENRSSKKS